MKLSLLCFFRTTSWFAVMFNTSDIGLSLQIDYFPCSLWEMTFNWNDMKVTNLIYDQQNLQSLNSCPVPRRPALWPVGGAVTGSVWARPPRATDAVYAAAVCDSRPVAAAPSAGSAGSGGALYRGSSLRRCCSALCAGDIQRCLCSGLSSVRPGGGWTLGLAEETAKNPSHRLTENGKENKFSESCSYRDDKPNFNVSLLLI